MIPAELSMASASPKIDGDEPHGSRPIESNRDDSADLLFSGAGWSWPLAGLRETPGVRRGGRRRISGHRSKHCFRTRLLDQFPETMGLGIVSTRTDQRRAASATRGSIPTAALLDYPGGSAGSCSEWVVAYRVARRPAQHRGRLVSIRPRPPRPGFSGGTDRFVVLCLLPARRGPGSKDRRGTVVRVVSLRLGLGSLANQGDRSDWFRPGCGLVPGPGYLDSIQLDLSLAMRMCVAGPLRAPKSPGCSLVYAAAISHHVALGGAQPPADRPLDFSLRFGRLQLLARQ